MPFDSETSYLDELTQSFSEFAQKHQHILQEMWAQQQEHLEINAHHFPSVWGEFAKKILEDPQKIVEAQLTYYREYLKICQNFSAHLSENATTVAEQNTQSQDKRFRDPEWQNNMLFDFIKQSYLLTADHMRALVKEVVSESDPKLAVKINFYTRQLIDAFSPANFINTNPEVLRSISQTGGKNLLQGFKQFLSDIETSHGWPNIKMTDLSYFEVGKNIAITPGKVIYQNEVMQLIQYQSATHQINQNPLLIIPPWINKYYILDLQPENSFVKWLVDQGHTVFMISWVNPTHAKANKGFADYMQEGLICALDIIEKIVGCQPINAIGYCVGGTLLAATLAYCAGKNDTRIKSATFLATLLDFSVPGDLGVFIDEHQVTAMEKYMQKKGYLDGAIMAAAFNSLRANELIWSYFIHNYLQGKKPVPFDLLYWNSDATNLPEKLHGYYLREMYLHNHLVQRGKLAVDGMALDLRKITVPSFFLATKDDHIVPWIGSYKSMQSLSGSKKFVLAGSGHVAGVINPPHKDKYGYWINTKKPKNPEDWLAEADYCPGSWWNCWTKWIKKHAGSWVSPSTFNNSAMQPIEDAPGSYVKVRVNEISADYE